jgi:DNA replication protein DnaC
MPDEGMVKLTADQRRDLMEVIDDRHDRGSTIVATQIPQERWHEQIGDPTYADAILDRLVNNAYRFELKGKSMRGNSGRRATEHATEGVADPAVDEIGEQSK